MIEPTLDHIRECVSVHAPPQVPISVRERPRFRDRCFEFHVDAGEHRWLVRWYGEAHQRDALHEISGLRLAGTMGLAPELVWHQTGTDHTITAQQRLHGDELGERPLDNAAVNQWLFLLLTLHHLPVGDIPQSPDAVTNVVAWQEARQARWQNIRGGSLQRCGDLVRMLDRLAVIIDVHVRAHARLWDGIPLRPCHGSASAENLVRADGRLYLVNWWNVAPADAAFDTAYAAGLTALQGGISTDQYRTLLTNYLNGMQDSGDASLEERLRIIATVLPFWFACRLLEYLEVGSAAGTAHMVRFLIRALEWLQGSLGVEIADPAQVTAPLLTSRA